MQTLTNYNRQTSKLMKKNTGIAVSSYDKEKSFENASYLRTYHDPDGEKNY